MAQSRLRQPLTNPAEPGIPKSGARKNAHIYAAIVTLLLADIAFLSIAALTGFLIEANFIRDGVMGVETTVAVWAPFAFVAIAVGSMAVLDLQRQRPRGVSAREWVQIIGSVSFASLIVWGVSEAIEPNGLNLEMAMAVWVSSILIMPMGRVIARQAMRSRGIGSRKVVVVGDINQAMPVIKQLSKNGSQYRVAGMVSAGNGSNGKSNRVSFATGQESTDGNMKDLSALPEVMAASRATEVLIAVSNGQYAAVRDAVRNSTPPDTTVHVAISPLLDEATSAQPTEIVDGVPAVRLKGPEMPWQYETVKRWFDVTAAVVLLLLASPLMAMVAIAVKLDSNGPVFFKQARVGRNAVPFGMYKFRSMRANAEAMLPDLMKQNEAGGAMFKMKNDPRITRVGKVIRKLSLDELPQLFNVLNGTMSLVGPRPPLPREVAIYEPQHYQRLGGVPGITGLWQVKRGPVLDFNEMLTYDLEYLRTWSLKNDILIMLRTIPVVITGRGAY